MTMPMPSSSIVPVGAHGCAPLLSPLATEAKRRGEGDGGEVVGARRASPAFLPSPPGEGLGVRFAFLLSPQLVGASPFGRSEGKGAVVGAHLRVRPAFLPSLNSGRGRGWGQFVGAHPRVCPAFLPSPRLRNANLFAREGKPTRNANRATFGWLPVRTVGRGEGQW